MASGEQNVEVGEPIGRRSVRRGPTGPERSGFTRRRGTTTTSSSRETGGPEHGIACTPGAIIRLSARVANPLATGHYFIHVGIGNEQTGQFAAFRKNAADFVVFGTNLFGGMVKLDCELEVEQVEEAPIR